MQKQPETPSEIIKAARDKSDLTVEELTDRVGITERYLYRIENEGKVPTFEVHQGNCESRIGKPNRKRIKTEPITCLPIEGSGLSALRLSVWHFCFCDIQLLCIYQCLLVAFGAE